MMIARALLLCLPFSTHCVFVRLRDVHVCSIPAPLFVTWFQCVLTAIFTWGLGLMRGLLPGWQVLSHFPKPEYDTVLAWRVMPLSIVFVLMIALNNMCLMFVEVSFYNVAKALSLLFNVLLGYLLLRTTISWQVACTVLVVIFGFLVGSEGEQNFTFWGTTFGVLSSAMSPLNSIMTKRVLPAVGDDNWLLALYNNINAALLFLPVIVLSGELSVLQANWDIFVSSRYWLLMLATGALGFAIGTIVVMVIKYTSPLSFNIAGTFKNSLQTVLAVYVFRNSMTFNSYLGVVLVLVGSLAYAYVCNKEANMARMLRSTSMPDMTIKLSKVKLSDNDLPQHDGVNRAPVSR